MRLPEIINNPHSPTGRLLSALGEIALALLKVLESGLRLAADLARKVH